MSIWDAIEENHNSIIESLANKMNIDVCQFKGNLSTHQFIALRVPIVKCANCNMVAASFTTDDEQCVLMRVEGENFTTDLTCDQIKTLLSSK